MITIEDIDMGFDAAWEGLESLDGAEVDGGLLDPEQAQKGVLNEFGTRQMPGRPWLSVAADNGVPQIMSAAKGAALDAADGAKASVALEPVGETVRDLAKGVIRNQQVGGPPLGPSAVRSKGHGTKLIDSGEMLAEIDYEVRVK